MLVCLSCGNYLQTGLPKKDGVFFWEKEKKRSEVVLCVSGAHRAECSSTRCRLSDRKEYKGCPFFVLYRTHSTESDIGVGITSVASRKEKV